MEEKEGKTNSNGKSAGSVILQKFSHVWSGIGCQSPVYIIVTNPQTKNYFLYFCSRLKAKQ